MFSKAAVVVLGIVVFSWSSELFVDHLLSPCISRAMAFPALRGRPASIDREIGAGDLRGVVAAQKQRQRGHLLDRDEFLRGLGREQDVADDLIPPMLRAFIVFGICFSTSGVQT